MSEPRDVVVVGAGPAGSAAAIFLRQRGRDVLLLDEARFPRDKICGESISPGAHRLLADLGVEPAVRVLAAAQGTGPGPTIGNMTAYSDPNLTAAVETRAIWAKFGF